jgi:hypothetical protein
MYGVTIPSDAIYVKNGGIDTTNCGLVESPCLTLSKSYNRYSGITKHVVLLADLDFEESLSISGTGIYYTYGTVLADNFLSKLIIQSEKGHLVGSSSTSWYIFLVNNFNGYYRYDIEVEIPFNPLKVEYIYEDYTFSIGASCTWYWEHCIWSFSGVENGRNGSIFYISGLFQCNDLVSFFIFYFFWLGC